MKLALSTILFFTLCNCALNDGLLYYFDFNNQNNPLNNQVGRIGGNCTNCPIHTSDGKFGGAIALSNNRFFEIPANDNQKVLAITMSSWVNPAAVSSYSAKIISKPLRNRWNGASWTLGAQSSRNKEPDANISSGTAYAEIFNPAAIALNTWHHLTAVWDGTALRIFVNGTEQSSTPADIAMTYSNTMNVCIGCRSGYDVGECLTGKIDEVAIWNRALSTAEVFSVFRNGLAALYPSSALASTTTQSSETKRSSTSVQSSATTEPITTTKITMSSTFLSSMNSVSESSLDFASSQPDFNKENTSNQNGGNNTIAIAVGLVGGFIGVIIFCLGIIFIVMRRRSRKVLCTDDSESKQNPPPTEHYLNMPKETQDDVGSAYSGLPASIVNVPFKISTELKPYIVHINEVSVLKKPIGIGSSGIVYKGIWKNDPVAVKTLKSEDAVQLKMLQQECILMKSISSHKNVVQLLGIIEDPLSLITEYCLFGSLDQYLYGQEPIDMAKRIGILTDVAQGMIHLQKHDIVHRDLAARNCLLAEGFVTKVSDFGMSRITQNEITHTVANVGPVKWMAPEIFNTHKYSSQTDVYSFGVLCIEVLTRQVPYPNIALDDFIVNVLLKDLTSWLPSYIPVSTSAPIKDIITRCLSKDPTQRPTFEMIVERFREQPKSFYA